MTQPTTWTKQVATPTSYGNHNVVNLGAIMDDTKYQMDDAILTMDDLKLNIGVATPTSWTKS